LKVSSTIVVQALRPPEEGCRRYQRPEPRTRREEGEEVGRPRYSIVLVVLRKGSLIVPPTRSNQLSAHSLHLGLVDNVSLAFRGTHHQKLKITSPPFFPFTLTSLSVCLSPADAPAVPAREGSMSWLAA
jgi:hypothetical protein